MNIDESRERIQAILTQELPHPTALISEGHDIADNLKLGRSLFCEKMSVSSEADYKAQRMRDGAIMYHAHIGMGSWSATAKALNHIYQAAQDEGYVIDRAGICLTGGWRCHRNTGTVSHLRPDPCCQR